MIDCRWILVAHKFVQCFELFICVFVRGVFYTYLVGRTWVWFKYPFVTSPSHVLLDLRYFERSALCYPDGCCISTFAADPPEVNRRDKLPYANSSQDSCTHRCNGKRGSFPSNNINFLWFEKGILFSKELFDGNTKTPFEYMLSINLILFISFPAIEVTFVYYLVFLPGARV